MNRGSAKTKRTAATEARFGVALAQTTPVLGNVRANVMKAAALAAQAADAGARLVVFPELALTGYFLKDLASEVARPVGSPDFEPLAQASRRIGIIAGFVEEGADAGLYNAAAFWLGGRPLWVQRKIYLPTYGMFDEGRYLACGRELQAFDSPFGRAGILICEDLWHLSTVYVMAQDGARLLIVVSSSPTREAGGEKASRVGSIWHDLIRVLAVMHGVHVIFVNRVGFEDGVNFWGGSRIMGPDGNPRAESPLFDEALTYGEIDPIDVLRERTRSHHVWDEDPHLTLRSLSAALARRAAPGAATGAASGADARAMSQRAAGDGSSAHARASSARAIGSPARAGRDEEAKDVGKNRRRTGRRAPARAHRRSGHAR